MGIHVGFRDLGRVNGFYLGAGMIVINAKRTAISQRVTLAHEMGHWHHDHDWRLAHNREGDESEANTYAARLLIRRDDFMGAQRRVGTSVDKLAEGLDVTPALVELRRQDFERDTRFPAVVVLEQCEPWAYHIGA